MKSFLKSKSSIEGMAGGTGSTKQMSMLTPTDFKCHSNALAVFKGPRFLISRILRLTCLMPAIALSRGKVLAIAYQEIMYKHL
jgi:hypothetical protein